MLRNPFSSRTSDLSPDEAVELANKRLDLARKEDDSAKKLKLANSAKSLLKDAEIIFASTKVKDPAFNEDIANAYHGHGTLLDDMGHHDKAKKSHKKAGKWGYVDAAGRNAGPSHTLGKNDTIHRLLLPTAPLSVAPSVTATMHQDSSKTGVTQLIHQDRAPAKVNNDKPAPNKNNMQTQQKIFDQNVAPPVARYALPEAGERISSTPQLAYCLSLLHPSMISEEELDQSERDWLQVRVVDPDEKERLQTMETDMVRAFVQEVLKKPDVVSEIVSLAAVLGQDDFRKLLQAFVDGINQSLLLDVHLLNGLAQLIRNAPQGYIDADDLVKILKLLNARLKDTHKQSTLHIYQLSLTISQVLDSMVDSQVKGLSREQLHEPLSDYLKGLQQNPDPYLIYQAVYAYQALQYIPDDETILQCMMRRTGKVVRGISGVVSAVKALDLVGFIEGLQNIQQSLTGVETAIELVTDTYSNVVTLAKSGQDLLTSLKEGLSFNNKGSWYPALRGLDRLVQEGRFADFEKLVREAPCLYNPGFRLGVCQRLGEIAANPIWDLNIRKCAVEFLGQLYKDDADNGQQVNIKQWIFYILSQLAESSKDTIDGPTQELLQEAQTNSSSFKGTIGPGHENDISALHPIMVSLPPMESPLLDCVQNKIDVEIPLRQLKRERLKDRSEDVYISPRAKATPKATDHFDLTTKAQEFLASDRKVFLILGDSGAGKSIFNRNLEISLWEKYETNGRIPLFIHLPEIDKPEQDLIDKHLRKIKFTEAQILELKAHREFIMICDGYDESQQTRNLYMSNQLNRPGGWRVQMVISCRTEYIGVDYRHCFEPSDRNSSGKVELLQEAIIVPFNKDQIQSYVEQYVSLKEPSWSFEDYHQAFKKIPNLQDLVKNPFLLKLALEVLPQLLGNNSNYSTARITRIELYDEFVTQWVERSKKRLADMELSSHDKSVFMQLSGSGFLKRGITYLKELVAAIYEHQNGSPVVRYSEYDDQKTWKEAFFGDRDGGQLLREVIPLTRNGDQYRFIHKSLLEYGLSLAVFGPSKHNEDTEAIPPMSRRGSTSSILSFERPSTERTGDGDDQSLLDSPLGKRNLVGELSVLQFLTERVQQEPLFKGQLHSVIERSKTDKRVRTAAANAITILVRAGVQFINMDLRNIQIPGADLSFGVFDSAQLEGADLRKVNLRNVWMRQADLRGAQMKGVQFGELPFLKEDSGIFCSMYSPDGKTYAVGSQDGSISLYMTANWTRTQRLKGHSSEVNSLSFSATGDRVASGSSDSTVRLWDVDTGECVHTFQGHSGSIWSVVYSPKGDRIASGSNDSTVRLWDVDTGECIHTLQGHSGNVWSVAYSPKGDRIASGSEDKTVRLWGVDAGECIYTLQGHDDTVWCVAYSPKGDRITSGSYDSTARVWDVDTGECVHTLQGHTEWVQCIAYSPKGNQIASGAVGGQDSTLRLWDADTGECLHILQGHSDGVTSFAYSPKGDRIASGSGDNTVRVWDVDTGECIHTLQGHSSSVRSVAYSPKGDRIASGSSDKTVRLWDVNTGESVHTFQSHSDYVNNVVYSPKGDRIASGGNDPIVRLWDIDTGECTHTLQDHGSYVDSVVYSPKGDQIATGSSDNTVRLWDADTGECIHTLQGHTSNVYQVVYSPKGDRIASVSYDSAVRLWDVNTGECIHTLLGHTEWVLGVVYSPKGDRIASGGYDSTVRLWDVDTGECLHILQDHSDWVQCVACSPKGDRIASGSFDTTVRLWDVDSGECVHTLQGHNGRLRTVVYSPNGSQIASGCEDSTVRLWNVDTGECLHTLQGHSKYVNCVAYSPKGDRIASGSDDKTVKLWDVETGQCQVTILGYNGSVSSVAFKGDADALRLITGSWDKSVRRWQITKEGSEYKAVLCWSSSHEVLTVDDLSFEDVQGLSQLNRELLIQRGALTPNPLSSD